MTFLAESGTNHYFFLDRFIGSNERHKEFVYITPHTQATMLAASYFTIPWARAITVGNTIRVYRVTNRDDLSTYIEDFTLIVVAVTGAVLTVIPGLTTANYPLGLNGRAYGMVADFSAGTGTDNTAFLQAVITAANAGPVKTILIPAGDYYFNSLTSIDPGAGGLRFQGAGKEATVFHFEEGTSGAKRYLFKNIDNTTKGGLRFEGIQFQGTWTDSNQFDAASNPLWLDYYDFIELHDCYFKGIGGMAMDFHYTRRFVCTDCRFVNIARDSIRARDCSAAFVSGNHIRRSGDDAIALHTATGTLATYLPQRERLIVTNNIIENCQGGIQLVGWKVATVAHNYLALTGNGIMFKANYLTAEGNNPNHDLIVEDNTVHDSVIVRSVTPGASLGPSTSSIFIETLPAQGGTGSDATIPGNYNTTTLLVVRSHDWYQANHTSAADAFPRASRIHIKNNIISRTRKLAAAFSAYGYGSAIWQGITYDPAITEAYLYPTAGVHLAAVPSFDGLYIEGNTIHDCATGISMPAPAADRNYLNCSIKNNRFRNVTTRGILLNSSGTFNVDMTIDGNEFDCDPYRRAANSNLNGTYAADTVPFGIDTGSAQGVIVTNNKFRNCCRMVQTNVPLTNTIWGNYGYCSTPAAAAFNVGNMGIGNILLGNDWEYIIENSDPTNAAYGDYLQKMLRERATIPASGWYYAGWFVADTSGVTRGWKRAITGTAHVSGTDWLVM